MDRHDGVFPTEGYVDEMYRELAKVNLNDPLFLREIARSFVRTDIAQRANVNPFVVDKNGVIDLSKFRRAKFRKGLIRLGKINGKTYNVKMIDATGQQWLTKMFHEQIAAEAVQVRARLTGAFLHTEAGILLQEDTKLKTGGAFVQVARDGWLWDVAIDDDDDDGDDEVDA
jgi:hypothetical protein